VRYLIIGTYIILAYKFSDWRNWKSYYPTILFMILGDMLYNFIAYNHPLWEQITPNLSITFSVLFINFTAWPAITLLYLTYFPETGKLKKALYILMWVLIHTLTELFLWWFGYYEYSNGWHIGWSMLFDALMFPLLIIHHRKPQFAWPLAFLIGTTITCFFIPLSSMK
jgi:hypothetical protein